LLPCCEPARVHLTYHPGFIAAGDGRACTAGNKRAAGACDEVCMCHGLMDTLVHLLVVPCLLDRSTHSKLFCTTR
jgi:hypothetical protein